MSDEQAALYPMAFGQLSVWRFIEKMPPEQWWQSNVGSLVRIPQGVTADGVRKVLHEITRRHESLRTTFDLTPSTPKQLVHDVATPLVEEVDLDDEPELSPGDERKLGTAFTYTEAIEMSRPVMGVPFGLVDGPGWSSQILTVRGRPAYLALASSHIVMDGWSLEWMAGQIAELLAAGPDAIDGQAPVPPGPAALAMEQHSDAWADRRASARAYWQRLVDEFAPPSADGSERPEPGPRISGTLDLGAASGMVSDLSRRLKAFPQAVFLALLGVVVAATEDRRRVVAPVMSSNRYEPPWKDVISSMTQQISLGITVDPDEPFSAYVPRVTQLSNTAYQNGCYDVDAMFDLSSRLLGEHGSLDHFFSYAAIGAPRPLPASELAGIPPALPVMGSSVRLVGARLYFIVGGGKESLAVILHADSRLYPEDTLRGILVGIEDVLRMVAVDAEVKVGELVDRVTP